LPQQNSRRPAIAQNKNWKTIEYSLPLYISKRSIIPSLKRMLAGKVCKRRKEKKRIQSRVNERGRMRKKKKRRPRGHNPHLPEPTPQRLANHETLL
jgi:hypothetical protein